METESVQEEGIRVKDKEHIAWLQLKTSSIIVTQSVLKKMNPFSLSEIIIQ